MKKLTHLTEDSFTGQKVLVFGFGVNGGGLGTVEFLLTTEAEEIVISDMKTEEELASTKSRLPEDQRLKWHLGGHDEADFIQADIIIKNPGIRWDHPLIILAEEHGASVLMDSAIFMALCQAPIIGVTGSKGKTTTATLIAHILETAGHHVVRVGISQIGVLSELTKVTEGSMVVFELSSWRLSGLRSIEKSPDIAVITNLYPDHLNYYASMEEYAEDKAQIFSFQKETGVSIFDCENTWTKWFIDRAPGKTICFGKSAHVKAWQDERSLFLKADDQEKIILEKDKVFFTGDYMFANFLAASLVTYAYGVDIESIRKGLIGFQGVPHRFELVATHNGVTYINDTAATIPEASLASVQAVKNNVILLAGGSDKGLPLEPLIEAIKRSKYTFLFAGSGTESIDSLLQAEGYKEYQIVASMDEALKQARMRAEQDTTVLLAPGAASFGMFRNEFDRGDQFRAAVLAVT